MRCLVTGAAGFIGSTLSERLLEAGHEVIGVDCFVDYYPRTFKEQNLSQAMAYDRFTFHEADLCDILDASARRAAVSPNDLLDGVDVIYHQAAQAGVRASWGRDFSIYLHNNIDATQRLLEACKDRQGLRIVYASSSSVYGETENFPMREDDLASPVSPYGVSKLAAEHLMRLYHVNFGVHTVSLRYFTVYGPRQRPDMAFHRLIAATLSGEEFTMFGNGEQSRDFTFINDIVQANIDAGQHGKPGGVYNIGGGTSAKMNDVIERVGRLSGKTPRIRYAGRERGDVTKTGADTSRARTDWGFAPKVSLDDGLAAEIRFIDEVILPGPLQSVSDGQ